MKSGKPKGKAAIKAAIKKKKREAGEDSDASDDFMPIKAAPKARAALKPKVAAKASPVKRARSVLFSPHRVYNCSLGLASRMRTTRTSSRH